MTRAIETLTDDELRAIAEREAAATAGPWSGDPEPFAIYIYGADGGMVADTHVPGKYGEAPSFEDGERGGVDAVLRLRGVGASKSRPAGSLRANYRFMVHAREDVSRLLATVEELKAELAKLRGACFENHEAVTYCKLCKYGWSNGDKARHADGCAIAALDALERESGGG